MTIQEALRQQLYFSSLTAEVCCTCSECLDPAQDYYPQVFRCGFCDREVPWCFGQDDDYPDFCDDCAVYLLKIDRCPCGNMPKLDCAGECDFMEVSS